MLSGVLLIVIGIIFVLTGTVSGTGNALNSQSNTFSSSVSIDIVKQFTPNLAIAHPTGNVPDTDVFPCCVSNGATEQCTAIKDNTAVLFHMDQSAGTQVLDNTVAARHGTCVGMGANCRWAAGMSGNGVDFRGGSETVQLTGLAVDTSAGPKKNAVEFWMYWRGTEGQMPFGWGNAYDLYFAASSFGFNNGCSNVEGYAYAADLANNWHHVVAVFPNAEPVTDASAELWIDGVKKTITHRTPAVNPNCATTVTTSAFISGWGADGGYKFNGIIDEFAIYSKPLTATQIQAHFAAGAAKFYNHCTVTALNCPSGMFNRGKGECA